MTYPPTLTKQRTKQKKTATQCVICTGRKRVACDVCRGERALKYHPFRELPPPPLQQHGARAMAASTWTCCAMCGASGEQACLNCLGEGVTYPS